MVLVWYQQKKTERRDWQLYEGQILAVDQSVISIPQLSKDIQNLVDNITGEIFFLEIQRFSSGGDVKQRFQRLGMYSKSSQMNENCMTYVNCTTQLFFLLHAPLKNRSFLENMILLSPSIFQNKRFNILISWFDGNQGVMLPNDESEVYMTGRSTRRFLGLHFPSPGCFRKIGDSSTFTSINQKYIWWHRPGGIFNKVGILEIPGHLGYWLDHVTPPRMPSWQIKV